ncbi:MAG: hypothetical protein U0270_31160 [Labilithrix sp.]
MPLAREYFPSDTLKLINRSEHLVVRGGVRDTTAKLGAEEKHGAHTIGRHLIDRLPTKPGERPAASGSLGKGVKFDDFRDRFLNAPENKSSAFAGKGEMAILLCELLNSDVGQYALRLLDRGTGRVVVHYFNERKLAGLFNGLAGKATFQESTIVVTPAKEKLEAVLLWKADKVTPVIDPKTQLQKQILKKVVTPKSSVADVKAESIVAVNAVLDRFDNGRGLHLQTFYPSSEAVSSYCEWTIGVVTLVACADKNGVISNTILPQAS